MYNFTKLALELNEPNDEAVAPTDSRRRPDQRSMENGRWDEANRLKERLEQKQREAHKLVEAKAEKNGQFWTASHSQSILHSQQKPRPKNHYTAFPRSGQDPAELLAQPRWFKKIHDQNTDTAIHLVLNQEYWECKERQDWSRCPDIF
jgi:oxysterol-binding protein 1